MVASILIDRRTRTAEGGARLSTGARDRGGSEY